MWGFYSTKMRISDYEEMLDLGYQRSGNYFYKPDIEKSCCPLYTPRLDNAEFVISKSQKKVMKRFNKYINGERDGKEDKNLEIEVLDDAQVKLVNGKKDFDDYIKKLEREAKEIKEFIVNTEFLKGKISDMIGVLRVGEDLVHEGFLMVKIWWW